MSGARKRAKYTLEFKMEEGRLVKGGQAVRNRLHPQVVLVFPRPHHRVVSRLLLALPHPPKKP